MNISIHALREEGDEDALDFLFEVLGFLSTPSARRATQSLRQNQLESRKFLSTPSARRATCSTYGLILKTYRFLSTPSARRATRGSHPGPAAGVFLSTPSARRATSVRM